MVRFGNLQIMKLLQLQTLQWEEKMTVDKICRGCIRCKKLFNYGNMDISLRGQMTRKYCNECIVLQHRDESRLYQRRKRLNMRIM